MLYVVLYISCIFLNERILYIVKVLDLGVLKWWTLRDSNSKTIDILIIPADCF